MRKTLLLLLMPVMLPVADAKKPLETPVTDAEFEKILTALKDEAKTFAAAADDKGPSSSKTVAGLQYSAKSSAPLVKVIKALPSEPLEKLYVAFQILGPLKMSSDETMNLLSQPLFALLVNDCRYKSMPGLSGSDLSDLAPPKPSVKESPARVKRRNEVRRRKAAAEWAVVKYNRTVNALETTIKQILVLMNDPVADDALLQKIETEQKHRLITFEKTLSIIWTESGRMKKARAGKYYRRLKKIAQDSGLRKKRRYVNPTKPAYNKTGNSSFESKKVCFAVSVLKVVNVVATSAQEPAVTIPGDKPRKDPRRKTPRRPRRR